MLLSIDVKISKLRIKYDVLFIEDAFYSVFALGEAVRKIPESLNWKTSPSLCLVREIQDNMKKLACILSLKLVQVLVKQEESKEL
jgi:hypothetical protein